MNKSASITPAVLEGLEPLRELTPEALEALAEEAEIEDVPARSIIYRKDAEDVWVRYLLSGSVPMRPSRWGCSSRTGKRRSLTASVACCACAALV